MNVLANINSNLANITDFYYPFSWQNMALMDGWYNFFTTFQSKSFSEVLKDTLLEVQKEIDNSVNPLSDDNKEQFNANLDSIKNDTAIGSAIEIKDGISNFYTNISGATPTASLTVNTLPVSFYGVNLISKPISIDFSWFSPYRDTVLSLWRFFLWTSYIFILFKRLPDIIRGVGMYTDAQNEILDTKVANSEASAYYDMLVSRGGKDIV